MSTAQVTTQAQEGGGNNNAIFIALVPWVLFTVVAAHGTLKIASILSLALALVIAAPGLRARRPKALELGAVAAFAGFTVIAFAADPSTGTWLEHYARAVAAGLLALIAFGSLLFVPFTEQYAREQVPREAWSSARFKSINRQITVLWGGTFLLMVPGHIVAGELNMTWSNLLFNWAVPIGLVLFAIKRMGVITGDAEAAR